MNTAATAPLAAHRHLGAFHTFQQPKGRHAFSSLAVLGGHALLLWGLLHLGVLDAVVAQAQPLMVSIVNSTAPPQTPPPPMKVQAPMPALPTVVLTVPEVPLQREAPPSPLVVQAAPAAAPTPSPNAAPVVVAAVAAPPPPPAVQKVPASALRYTVQPPVEVPVASRRLRETGTVLLRVVVDVRGQPRSVQLLRSSGFERLDQQALWAMRQARFQPCTRDGQPVECESDAPFAYDLEN